MVHAAGMPPHAIGYPGTLGCQHVTKLTSAPAGIMSLDFHPQQGNVLAVGLYSGNIEVHNVMAKNSTHPLYKTSAAAGKHLGAVTAIRWDITLHISRLRHGPGPSRWGNFCSVTSSRPCRGLCDAGCFPDHFQSFPTQPQPPVPWL